MLPNERIKSVKFFVDDTEGDDDDDDAEAKAEEEDDVACEVNKVRLKPWPDPRALTNALQSWSPKDVWELENAKFVWTTCLISRSSGALEVLDEMISNDIYPDIQTFSGSMYHFAKQGDSKNVQKIFGMVRQSGTEPNTYIFKVLIHGYCKCDQAALAWKVFEDMRSSNLLPDCATKELLLKSLKFMKSLQILLRQAVVQHQIGRTRVYPFLLMGWLKRILKGSISSSRQRSSRSCEEDDRCPCSDEPNDMELQSLNVKDESTEGEEEETDYQIGCIRSFSEDGQVDDLYGVALTKDWVQYDELRWEDEDERPTQSFQQSFTFEPFCPFDIANIFQPFPFSLYPDNGQAFLHPECVPSYASHGSLTGHQIFVSEYHSIFRNIHEDHHLNHYHHHYPRPLCYVCGQPIPVDANGRLLYSRHPFWRQKYCLLHERDETPSCW
ncbi:hypothetical protein NL676_014472, partial [Syzygium grande]